MIAFRQGRMNRTTSGQELFNTCVARGGSKCDHSGLVRALQIMANHEIGGK